MSLEKNKDEFLKELNNLRPDLFYSEMWSQEAKQEVEELTRPAKVRASIFAAIPMNCKAEKCPFANTCPLQQKGIAPKSKPCPIELALMSQFAAEYMEELDVRPDNLVEVSMIRDLVDQEIQYLRKSKILANEHFIQENIVGVDPQGSLIMKKELHQAVELEDRLHKRRKDLRNQLLATREAKAKAGQAVLNDSDFIADVFYKLQEHEIRKEQLLKETLGQAFKDNYIEAHIVEDEENPETH